MRSPADGRQARYAAFAALIIALGACGEGADPLASGLDGEVTQAGQYCRVRTGRSATGGEAEASLAKVRTAGYSDARILTNG